MVRMKTIVSNLRSFCFPDTPEGDTPPLAIGAAAEEASPTALLKGKGESDDGRGSGSGGGDEISRDGRDGDGDDDGACFEAGAKGGPTDDILRGAIHEVVIGTTDLGSITAKHVRVCTLR